jgi:hypothetical protein
VNSVINRTRIFKAKIISNMKLRIISSSPLEKAAK